MNKIAYMTCVLSLAFTMQACDDFLDSFPQDTVTNENFWKSKEDADKVLVDIYASLLPKDAIFFDEAMSDNAYLVWDWWGGAQQVANGSYTTSGEIPTNRWNGSYEVIRKCWFLLEGIEKIEDISEQDKNKIIGETYFMLAYNYYVLTSYFGDVPLVTETLAIPESKQLVHSQKRK